MSAFGNLWLRRLVMFTSLGFGILMVYDGPSRPTVKRGRLRLTASDCSEDLSFVKLTMDICSSLGIPVVQAPGEAEAECAMLQSEDVVDYVFSTDADTLLFGATQIMFFEDSNFQNMDSLSSSQDSRSYSTESESRRVKIYERNVSENPRSQYLLRVLLSGGDYGAGIAGIGSETARQAAHSQTGFAQEISSIYNQDWLEVPSRNTPSTIADDSFDDGQASDASFTDPQNPYEGDYEKYDGERQLLIDNWRSRLAHELLTNEHGYFSQKHPSIKIPESFPNTKIIYRYCFPLVCEYSTGPINVFFKPDIARLRLILDKAYRVSRLQKISNSQRDELYTTDILTQTQNTEKHSSHVSSSSSQHDLSQSSQTAQPSIAGTWRLANILILSCLIAHISERTDKFKWYRSIRLKRRRVERAYQEYVIVLNNACVFDILNLPALNESEPFFMKNDERLLLGPIFKLSRHFAELERTNRLNKPKSHASRNRAHPPKDNMQITQFFKISKPVSAISSKNSTK